LEDFHFCVVLLEGDRPCIIEKSHRETPEALG
jgi:hypothetical protein